MILNVPNTTVIPGIFTVHMKDMSISLTECIVSMLPELDVTAAKPTTVINIFDQHVRMSRRPLPSCLAMDEVYAFQSYNSQYVCVLMDYLDKKIIDVLPSRHKDTLMNYFMLIPLEEHEKVKFCLICRN